MTTNSDSVHIHQAHLAQKAQVVVSQALDEARYQYQLLKVIDVHERGLDGHYGFLRQQENPVGKLGRRDLCGAQYRSSKDQETSWGYDYLHKVYKLSPVRTVNMKSFTMGLMGVVRCCTRNHL